jgi:maltose O-acetyltransferase
MIRLLTKAYYSFLQYKKKRYINGLVNKGLRLGKNVLIVDSFFFDPSHCYLISIGDNCTICPNVRLIAHDASTKNHLGYTKFGKITIGENCFIGDSTIVLPNVSIGSNSIVGAGSVVTKSVPSGTVVAGNPARRVCGVEEYLARIRGMVDGGKKVFGEEYSIENLDDLKKTELRNDVEKSFGFII